MVCRLGSSFTAAGTHYFPRTRTRTRTPKDLKEFLGSSTSPRLGTCLDCSELAAVLELTTPRLPDGAQRSPRLRPVSVEGLSHHGYLGSNEIAPVPLSDTEMIGRLLEKLSRRR